MSIKSLTQFVTAFLLISCSPAIASGISTFKMIHKSPSSTSKHAWEEKLRHLPDMLSEEPLRIEPKAVVELTTTGGERQLIVPFVATKRLSTHDRIPRCELAIIAETAEPRLVRRSNTGFSDDYEPCTAVEGVSIIDINGDSLLDLVYQMKMVSSAHQEYQVLDVYLMGHGLQIHSSPEASTVLTEKYGQEWSSIPSSKLQKKIRLDKKLKTLKYK